MVGIYSEAYTHDDLYWLNFLIALIQRVSRASVRIDDHVVGAANEGVLILLGIHRTDTLSELEWLVKRTANLRIFRDDEGKMNRSLLDIEGDALVVSQFTLYGDTRKGNRPSFVQSAPPEIAEPLYEQFIAALRNQLGRTVASGEFGTQMDVELINDGPVTIWLEKRAEDER